MSEIAVEPRKQWCDAHWLPYREDRNLNGLMATLQLVQAFLEAHDAEAKGNHNVMNRLLQEKSPLCCWAGDGRLALIMEQATKRKGAA